MCTYGRISSNIGIGYAWEKVRSQDRPSNINVLLWNLYPAYGQVLDARNEEIIILISIVAVQNFGGVMTLRWFLGEFHCRTLLPSTGRMFSTCYNWCPSGAVLFV
jgi:hypothetical protein